MPQQANFGVGIATLIPPSAAADLSPIVVAELQEVQLDYSHSEVDLDGDKGFRIGLGIGKRKLSGKAKAAKLTGGLVGVVMDGATVTTGSKIYKEDTVQVVTHAATVPGSATWTDDLGVFDGNGNQYAQVAASPVGLQYTVTAGVYGFETSTQDGKLLKFRYLMTQTAGKTINLGNLYTGLATTYGLKLFNRSAQNGGLTLGAELFAAAMPKLSLAFKSDAWTIPDIDISVGADSASNVIKFYTA